MHNEPTQADAGLSTENAGLHLNAADKLTSLVPEISGQHGCSLDVALAYIRRGWNPVPIPFKKKKPISP